MGLARPTPRATHAMALVSIASMAMPGIDGGPGALAWGVGEQRVVSTAGAHRAAPGPEVAVMVVGRQRMLFGPARVRASSVVVGVGRRRCAVASGTPLALLEDVHHAGGPAVRLHDYGSCSASPRDGGSLFAYQVGPDRNRGQDGWVYKVDRRLGSTGGGDPAGPFGHGRLRSDQRVTWFWCTRGGACQRTLELSSPSPGVRAGQSLSVTVRGFDDSGTGAPVAGATVTLGHSTATTGSDGRARVSAPGPGNYQLGASAAGLVPAFPVAVAVR